MVENCFDTSQISERESGGFMSSTRLLSEQATGKFRGFSMIALTTPFSDIDRNLNYKFLYSYSP